MNNSVFLINKNKIINNYKSYSKIGSVFYPLKTNTNEIVIRTLLKTFDSNDGFLISNLNHFKLLQDMSISPKKICLINVLSDSDTTKYLYDSGVRFFVFDNIDSLNEFIKYADLSECKIAIRLNTMEVFDDTLMHLGASTIECSEMLKMLENKCNSLGVSFYLQTKIKNEVGALNKMLNYIKNNFKNYNIDFLSMAGIKKSSDIDIEFLNSVKKEMRLNNIILEPGKYLVGNTIDMVTSVIRIKKINNKNVLILKNGIYSGLLDVVLYNEKFKFCLADDTKIDFSYIQDEYHNTEVTICGGSSDSGDVIGVLYINDEIYKGIKVGTRILIKDVGSYFEEFFMPYGGDINKTYVEVDNDEI